MVTWLTNQLRTDLKTFVISFLLIIFSLAVHAQSPQDVLEARLKALTGQIPALEKAVDISVSGSSIQEFLRGIANTTGLNINVDPTINIQVTNNFSNVRVLDILLFLSREFRLDISVIGNILSVTRPVEVEKPRDIGRVEFNQGMNLLTIDISSQPLSVVAKEITRQTGKNVILAPGLESKMVSGYIQRMPFDGALDKFAFTNDMSISVTADSFYILKANEKKEIVQTGQTNQGATITQGRSTRNRQGGVRTGAGNYTLDVRTYFPDSLTVVAEEAPIIEVIKEVSNRLGINYFVDPAIEGTVTLNIGTRSYEYFLSLILAGTEFTWRYQNDIYLIGNMKTREVMDYTVIQFQNRTIDKILDYLPKDLTDGLELKEYPEMNSLLVTGPAPKVERMRLFAQQIDKIVPVIMIEVLIVDITKSYTVTTGIDAGLGTPEEETKGKVFPGIDVQLSTKAINDLINSLNGLGVVNIGNVTQNFYLNLKALENQGILKVRSTPKLSTLNGHEATLSIGNTEYYLEERTDIIGTQNPQLTTTQVYKPVNAELKVIIKPIVSGDDQITLEIEVEQSDFTERISQYAPPGAVSRNFKSMIRVRNQEMVLLGGLEEKRLRDTSAGTPFLSRIPVIKWLFSSRTREDSNSKLNVFIRPTIIN